MRRTRLLSLLLIVGLVATVSLATATAWYSDSETFTHQVTASDDFGGATPKVWVCKLVGPPEDPSLAPGNNPIEVSLDSLDALEGFADAHPSYVVESGDVECEVPEIESSESGTPEENSSSSGNQGEEADEEVTPEEVEEAITTSGAHG